MQHPDTLRKLTRVTFLAILALLIMNGIIWGTMGYIAHHTQTAT
jgi:hypothetical protein